MKKFLLLLLCLTFISLNTVFASETSGQPTIDESKLNDLANSMDHEFWFFEAYGYEYDNYDLDTFMRCMLFNFENDRVWNGDETYFISKGKDPKGKFLADFGYYKIPEDVVDTIITNKFNTTPDHSYNADWGYFLDGYYYIQFEGLGGNSIAYEVESYEVLSNNMYYLTLAGYDYWEETDVNFYVLAQYKDINGTYDWSYYYMAFDKNVILNSDVYNENKPAIKCIFNGEEIVFSEKPYIENGTTMVPMRVIFEKLGAVVSYDSSTKTITAVKDKTEIVLVTGSAEAKINGATQTLAVAAANINGTTMVPLRFVSEALGAKVDWNGETQTITITN